MSILPSMLVTFFAMIVLGLLAYYLDQRECEGRLLNETLETSKLVDAALEQRLSEIDQYRHDLAAILQRLGLEEVRAAEERAGASE